MIRHHIKSCAAAALAVLVALPLAAAPGAAEEQSQVWPGLKKDVFGDKAIAEEDGKVTLEAPYRADDAAMVPLTVRIPADIAPKVKKLTLIIDQNPAPVAATFTLGRGMGEGSRMMETRVRIDMYSHVRAVIETEDGSLHMTTKFVKASGGCSAPAGKDVEEALASIGKMQVRTFAKEGGTAPEAQVMMRHVQYSGMQLDQATGFYIPSKFVTELTVTNGEDMIFRMDGGISISENPNVRFSYAGGNGVFEVTAKDTDGREFSARHDPKGS
jgi:sulfur-oxidizing protein SoxY